MNCNAMQTTRKGRTKREDDESGARRQRVDLSETTDGMRSECVSNSWCATRVRFDASRATTAGSRRPSPGHARLAWSVVYTIVYVWWCVRRVLLWVATAGDRVAHVRYESSRVDGHMGRQ
jgi:hypothetical protein